MSRIVGIAATLVAVAVLTSCAGTSSAPVTLVVTTTQTATITASPSPDATISASPVENSPSTDTVQAPTEPTPEAKPYSGITCAALAEEATAMSERGAQVLKLIKVRSPKTVKDNRMTYKLPKGDKDVVVLSCKGTGVWSDASKSPVLVILTVDSDGSAFVAYKGQ